MNDTQSNKCGRDNSIRAEQTFCDQALESGVYDSMSDQEWVALCEQVATEARQDIEQPDAAAPLATQNGDQQ